MARRSFAVVAIVAIVALVAVIAWRFHPREAFDALPELPRLVENPAPAIERGIASAPYSSQVGAGLLACVLVGAFLVLRPSNAWHGALALALVAVHPCVWIATTTARGAAELIATAVAVLGAAACVRDRPIVREVGAGLLVVGAWLSPGGIGVAAFAIAMANRASKPLRPAVLLAVLPRVFGAPGVTDWFGIHFARGILAETAPGYWAGLKSAFATLAGGSASAWMSDGAGTAVALLGFVAALLFAATAARGARFAAVAAILGSALVGFAAAGTYPVATAGFVPLVLTLAVAVAEPRAGLGNRVANTLTTIVLLGLGGFTTWRSVMPATQAVDLLAFEAPQLGRARPLAHRAALLALERGGADAIQLEIKRRMETPAASADALDVGSTRDLAVLAAQFGLAEDAVALLDRALHPEHGQSGAHIEIEHDRATNAATGYLLDALDLKLRAGRPRVVLRDIEGCSPEQEPTAEFAADLFVRRATALALLSLSTKFEADREVRAERATAMFAAYDAALARSPDHVRALLDRGVALRATGRGIDAMKDFEKVAKLRPDLAAPRLELAKLYFSRGQGEAGEQEIAAAQNARGNADPDVILVMSQLLVARGDLVNAAQNARLLESLRHRMRGGAEELAALYTQLGAAAENARDEPLALEMASKARTLGADATGENAGRVARLLRQKRDYEAELAVLKDAEIHELPVPELREQLVAAYKNLGYARLLAGDKAGACASFLDAAERAASVEELGALPELITKQSAELGGATAERVLVIAKSAYANAQDAAKAQNWRGAEGAYRVSLALLPQNPYAWFQLGEALAAQQRAQDATEAWMKAKELGELLGMLDVVERSKERLKNGP